MRTLNRNHQTDHRNKTNISVILVNENGINFSLKSFSKDITKQNPSIPE